MLCNIRRYPRRQLWSSVWSWRHHTAPGSTSSGDFEIAPAVVLRGRETPAANIDLQCRQNELRHRQGPVALLAEIDEPILRLVSDVRVRAFLFGYSTFPARMAAARLVIVPGEHARLIWQCKDDLDALPELLGVTARKIRAGRTAIRHEQRVMHESS